MLNSILFTLPHVLRLWAVVLAAALIRLYFDNAPWTHGIVWMLLPVWAFFYGRDLRRRHRGPPHV